MGAKNVLRHAGNSAFARAKWAFFVVGVGVAATTEFRRIRRILGVNGPILAHFRPKFGIHFMASAPKKVFIASGMEIFAWAHSMAGIRQS